MAAKQAQEAEARLVPIMALCGFICALLPRGSTALTHSTLGACALQRALDQDAMQRRLNEADGHMQQLRRQLEEQQTKLLRDALAAQQQSHDPSTPSEANDAAAQLLVRARV